MTTLLTSIKSRLAELERTVPGIKRAYTNAPASLPPVDLPIFCNLVGPATYTKLGETLLEETRLFYARLYVKSIQGGIDGEAEAAVTEHLIAVRDMFISHPHLGKGTVGSALDFVENSEYLGDGGVMVMQFSGDQFLGSEFRINVTTVVSRSIAKFE